MTRVPVTMDVIEIGSPGPPSVLRLVSRPTPRARDGEVLVRVAAAGVNRPDLAQRLGRYPPPPGASDIPGLELSGTVVALGDGVTDLKVGDPVCALTAGGGYAAYAAVPAPQCLPVPAGLSMIEAAAIPETFFTVWTNVFDRGRLRAGETMLVHGGASGIGTTAIQLSTAFGATVYVTAGSPAKCAACEKLGAVRAINYRSEDFVEVLHTITNGRGIHLVLDMVGGDYVSRNLEVLAEGGRLVQIAFLHGATVQVNLAPLMHKRLVFTGSTLRPRSLEEKGAIARSLREHVWPLLERGVVRPVIHATFPLRDAAAAHEELERGEHVGKIVLTVSASSE